MSADYPTPEAAQAQLDHVMDYALLSLSNALQDLEDYLPEPAEAPHVAKALRRIQQDLERYRDEIHYWKEARDTDPSDPEAVEELDALAADLQAGEEQ